MTCVPYVTNKLFHSNNSLCILKKHPGQSLMSDLNIRSGFVRHLRPSHVKGTLPSHHKPFHFLCFFLKVFVFK